MKFIKLHHVNGEEYILNLDAVVRINPEPNGGSWISTSGNTFFAQESFDDIASATNIIHCSLTKKEPDTCAPLDTPIKDLCFNTRAYNILKKRNINTLGDVLERFRHREDINCITGLGATTRWSIVHAVNEAGYHFVWE